MIMWYKKLKTKINDYFQIFDIVVHWKLNFMKILFTKKVFMN